MLRVLFEAPADESPRASRHEIPVRVLFSYCGKRVSGGPSGERPPSGEHSYTHRTERPDVRPLVQRLTACCSQLMMLEKISGTLRDMSEGTDTVTSMPSVGGARIECLR